MATDETAGAQAPAKSAKVDEWRAFAVSQGMSQEDADAATKDQLLERFAGADTQAKRRTGKVEVYAPNRDFDGTVAGVAFAKGKGTADWSEHAVALAYFARQGYGIGETAPTPPEAYPTPAVSALEADAIQSAGGRLRDAAVDPHRDDFLPPVNAGKADPHGPLVVAPEIHHDGPAGLRPGMVAVDDPRRQSREESAAARAVLIERQDKGEALGVFGPDADTGELGLSDPGSADFGREEAARLVEAGEVQTKAQLRQGSDAPARNASQAEWSAYAIRQGMDPDEAAAATRKDLIERYGGEG